MQQHSSSYPFFCGGDGGEETVAVYIYTRVKEDATHVEERKGTSPCACAH